jgi:fatty acid desaturase
MRRSCAHAVRRADFRTVTGPEDLARKREEYRARRRERHRRRQPKVFAATAVLWALLALLCWLNPAVDAWLRWGHTVLAMLQAGLAYGSWWNMRRRDRTSVVPQG